MCPISVGSMVFLILTFASAMTYPLPKIARGVNGIWTSFRESVNDVLDCIAMRRPPTLSDVKFYLYTATTQHIAEEIKDFQINKSHNFNEHYDTKMLIHGYTQSCRNEHLIKMKDAYLTSGKRNIIMVNWETLAFSSCYPVVVDYVAFVGQLTGYLLEKLDPDKLHIIGFSLGAHIAGIGSEFLKKKPLRITGVDDCTGASSRPLKYVSILTTISAGLDPAGPMFMGMPANAKLDIHDGQNVDIIHTSRAGVGYDIGHADFYVNGGKVQPDCSATDVACSHRRALELYLESISSNVTFKAIMCDSFNNFESGKCSNNTSTFMGEPWLRKGAIRGRFFIRLHYGPTTTSTIATTTKATVKTSTAKNLTGVSVTTSPTTGSVKSTKEAPKVPPIKALNAPQVMTAANTVKALTVKESVTMVSEIAKSHEAKTTNAAKVSTTLTIQTPMETSTSKSVQVTPVVAVNITQAPKTTIEALKTAAAKTVKALTSRIKTTTVKRTVTTVSISEIAKSRKVTKAKTVADKDTTSTKIIQTSKEEEKKSTEIMLTESTATSKKKTKKVKKTKAPKVKKKKKTTTGSTTHKSKRDDLKVVLRSWIDYQYID